MISLQQCKEILGSTEGLSDQDILEIRDMLYAVIEQIFDAGQVQCLPLADTKKKLRHNQNVEEQN